MDSNLNYPLVSILIPCYNVEDKVHRLFDSILGQTYSHYEIIVVNDGSKDRTEDVIRKYQIIFQQKGIEFLYLLQDNGGVGKACETGLPYVKGDYLCWPDADDFYQPECIEKLLTFLLEHKSYDLVRCNANVYYEDNLSRPTGTLAGNGEDRFREDNMFLDYIQEKNVYFAPVCFMMRFAALKAANPNMKLYHGRTGQNYQMLLPVLYSSKFGYIDEALCCYLIFNGSVSHVFKMPYEMKIQRLEDKHRCVYDTLLNMSIPINDLNKFEEIEFQKFYTEKCIAAFDYGKIQDYKELRPQVVMTYYINKLAVPDRMIKYPIMFKFRYLQKYAKATLRNNRFFEYMLNTIRTIIK